MLFGCHTIKTSLERAQIEHEEGVLEKRVVEVVGG